MANTIFRNATIVNEGKIVTGDVLVKGDEIVSIGGQIHTNGLAKEINCEGLLLLPGIIDDQVHFREPGLTHKADIASESKAAVAGGVTTFMEMPNTKPAALTQELLQDKFNIASSTSYANYSFFMGVSNDNYDEVMRTSIENVCGLKIFMGSSTGNMLVDNRTVLEKIFAAAPLLIATHCEDEMTIINNIKLFNEKYDHELEPTMHPLIRSVEACYKSSSYAIELAKKYNTRLHILHISTAKELELFTNDKPLEDKRITAEVCVHHLYFDAGDYKNLGTQIQCNPAIKEHLNKEKLFEALLDDRLDIIATDHAPHTWAEKQLPYGQAPSGLPLVQHSLDIMMNFHHKGMISIEKIVEKICHAPAICFQIDNRGFIREGYKADLILYDPRKEWTISDENIFYKCGWSPLKGLECRGKVQSTYVNGVEVYNSNGHFIKGMGQRLTFNSRLK